MLQNLTLIEYDKEQDMINTFYLERDALEQITAFDALKRLNMDDYRLEQLMNVDKYFQLN